MTAASLGRVGGHRAMQAEPMGMADEDHLEELSFADLSDLADDLSDGSQWSLLDDVRRELNLRTAEGMGRLSRVFEDAVKTNGTIPWVDFTGAGKKLSTRAIAWWLREWAGTDDAVDKIVDLVIDPAKRVRLIAALAAEYAKEQADELLCAGWTL